MTTPRRTDHAPKKPSLFSRFKAGLKRAIGGGKKKDAAKAPAGMDPAGVVGAMVKGVVTIEALNRPFMLATVKGPNGNYLTLPVEDAALLEKLHIGQVLVLTYAELKVAAVTKL